MPAEKYVLSEVKKDEIAAEVQGLPYYIVESMERDEVIAIVNLLDDLNWKPYGPLVVVTPRLGLKYFQAMVNK